MTSALTLSVDATTLARLERAAAERGSTREALAEAAFAFFLHDQAPDMTGPLQGWQAERVRRGIADADAGRFVTAERIGQIVGKYD